MKKMKPTNSCNRSRVSNTFLVALLALTTGLSTALAETKVTLNDFYRPYELSEITPKNMQSWPYYRYVSMNWDEYGLFGTVDIMAAKKPATIVFPRSWAKQVRTVMFHVVSLAQYATVYTRSWAADSTTNGYG